MDIDWSKAPEGATHYSHLSGEFLHKNDFGNWFRRVGSDWLIHNVSHTNLTERPTKPQAPEWDGEGLPPVGCECEYRIGGGPTPWHRCTVKYVLAGDPHEDADGWRAVVWCPHLEKDQVAHLPRFEFRPIPAQAQRDRDELMEIITSQCVIQEAADAIIAAGWHK